MKFVAMLTVQDRPSGMIVGESFMHLAQLVYEFQRKVRADGMCSTVAYWNVALGDNQDKEFS